MYPFQGLGEIPILTIDVNILGLVFLSMEKNRFNPTFSQYFREFAGGWTRPQDPFPQDKIENGFKGDFYAAIPEAAIQTEQNIHYFNRASLPHPSQRVRTKIQEILDHLPQSSERESLLRNARNAAASLINLPDPRGVVIARNTTQALALFFWLSGLRIAKNRVAAMPRIMTTDAENIATWRAMCFTGEEGNPLFEDELTTYVPSFSRLAPKTDHNYTGVLPMELKVFDHSEEEILEQMENRIRRTWSCSGIPDVLILSHVLRQNGRALNIRRIIDHARALKTRTFPEQPELFVVVDGAQALGNLPRVDFAETGADLYVASPHKTLGSEGIGLAFFDPLNPRIQEGLKEIMELDPTCHQKILEGMFDSRLGILPNIFEQVNFHAVAGFVESVRELREGGWVHGNNFGVLHEYRSVLKEYLLQKLQTWSTKTGIPITFPETRNATSFIATFGISGMGKKTAEELAKHDVYLSYLAKQNVFRVSFHVDTKEQDIDALVAALPTRHS